MYIKYCITNFRGKYKSEMFCKISYWTLGTKEDKNLQNFKTPNMKYLNSSRIKNKSQITRVLKENKLA
jgi:hypothetical protein